MVAIHLIIFSKVDRIKHYKHDIELNISTNITTMSGQRQREQNEQHSGSASRLKNEIENQSIF